MKLLYLVRHAKSSWDDPSLSDIDRPLNKRGQKNAPMMGKRMKRYENLPEFIVSSPANRALATAQIIAGEIGFNKAEIKIENSIYGGGVSGLIGLINVFPAEVKCAMLTGHNPTMTYLANELSGSDIYNMPTCGIALIEFATATWKDVAAGAGRLVDFDYPKRQDAEDMFGSKLNC